MCIKCHKFRSQTRPRILVLCNERSSGSERTAFGKHSHRRKKGRLRLRVFESWADRGFWHPLKGKRAKSVGVGGRGRVPAPCVTERPRNQKLIKIVRALIAHCSWTWRGYVSLFCCWCFRFFTFVVCGGGCPAVSVVWCIGDAAFESLIKGFQCVWIRAEIHW